MIDIEPITSWRNQFRICRISIEVRSIIISMDGFSINLCFGYNARCIQGSNTVWLPFRIGMNHLSKFCYDTFQCHADTRDQQNIIVLCRCIGGSSGIQNVQIRMCMDIVIHDRVQQYFVCMGMTGLLQNIHFLLYW